MSNLLPPNATAIERAIDASVSRMAELPVDIRQQWDPDTCPAALLPWLAWALSIDSWKPSWPESVKRQRVKQAVEIQRRKGTAKSVRDVVASFGSSLAIREWWQTSPPGTPHTFELVLTLGESVPNTAEYQQDIVDAINRTKPVRAHFTLTTGISARGSLGLFGATRPITYRRLRAAEA